MNHCLLRITGYILCYILFITHTFGQSASDAHRLIFDHFKVTDGLSQSWAITINQDEKGFIWIGTRDGLNRYDSRTFKVYRSDERDSTTLNSSHISSILIDSKKRMWVGTANGLNLYNDENDNFTRITDLNKANVPGRMYVHNILEDSAGIIWFTSDRGLHRFSPSSDKNTDLVLSDKDIAEVANSQMKALFIDQNHRMWVGIDNGIVRLDLSKSKDFIIQLVIKLPPSDDVKEFGLVNDIVEYPKGTMWLATERGGFFKLDVEKLEFEHFSHHSTHGNLVNDHVRRLMIDEDLHELWLGTRNGLSIYHLNSGKFENYQNEIDDPSSLSENSIHSIFKDKDGSCWIGTYHGGVNLCNLAFFKFTTYRVGKYNRGLNYNAISAINEIEPGKTLIGTEGGGINYYDRLPDTYKYYENEENNKNSLSHNNVKCILKDTEGTFWIGTSGGGICIFDPHSEKFKQFSQEEIGIRRNGGWVYSIDEDRDGLLWIGNFRVGLISYNRKTKEHNLIKGSEDGGSIVSNLIRKVLVDSKNRIWVGTDDGLSLYEKEKERFVSFLKDPDKEGSLSSNVVFSIYEDSHRNIWVGTLEGGLNRYDEKTGSFETFNTRNGLPGNNIFGIVEDSEGMLWISTNAGISKFNPARKTFKNYTTQDGLLDMEYSYNSYFKSGNGELFFGGRNGLISFYPESVLENKIPPSAVITDLKLFNKPVNTGDQNHILEKQIVETDHIVLNHRQNVFTLGFTVLNFIKPSKNKYAYRLEGLEEEWNYVDVPSATYTNLRPGTYTFMAKGANNDGVWNEAPAKLEITVLPAPWKTIWAYCLYLIFILAAIFTLVRYQRIKVGLQHDLKVRDLENQQQKELNQAKLKFFTDISHEIRTPLTLILPPLDNLISEYRSEVKLFRQLIGIKNNAGRLLRLINQLLDFRKKESGEIRLRVAEGNIVKFIREIQLAFQEKAKRQKIALHFYSDVQELKIYYDRDELEKVFFNLINNAIRYTPEGGKVELEVAPDTVITESGSVGMVKIDIRDNGMGINADDMDKIFERYYNGSNPGLSKLSTGIGLSLSKAIVKAHKGDITCTSQISDDTAKNCTTFTVHLPVGKEIFASSEIIEDFKDSENIENYYNLLERFDELTIPLPDSDERQESHQCTLLVAEDNNEIRSFLVEHLSSEYNIVEADNGEDALSLAFETIPDMVVTDVIMPKMDGLQLCSLLKNDERTSHIPVIILTARTSLIHTVNGLESGADEYITKPFNMKLMKVKIRNLIKSHDLMRKKFSKEFTLQPENIVLTSPDEKFLSRVKDLIEEHISDPDFNVDFFLKEIGMSRPVLYRKIKALTNMSVIELINSYRLNKAANILKNNQYSIAETATFVGFSDPKYFSKAFRKKFGLSPSEYTRQQQEVE